jgi:hypothetical protein
MSKMGTYLLHLNEQGRHDFVVEGQPEGIEMNLKIEKGIKTPRKPRATLKPLDLPLAKLKLNDSVLVPFKVYDIDKGSKEEVDRFIARIRTALARFGKVNTDFYFAAFNRLPDENGVRVFRVEGRNHA